MLVGLLVVIAVAGALSVAVVLARCQLAELVHGPPTARGRADLPVPEVGRHPTGGLPLSNDRGGHLSSQEGLER
jgi:hypothetical protein